MVSFQPKLYARGGVEGERREKIVRVLGAALEAVDPGVAVKRYVRREGEHLWVDGRPYDLERYERILVVGTGKAGAPMTQALEEILGDRITAGHVNVKYAHVLPTRTVRIHEAGHPIPDEAGEAGAQAIAGLLRGASARDLVFCVISGGGSALLPAPEAGISLADLKVLTDALLRAGATINEINAIRKHLDVLKGGKLARLAHPAQVVALLLSDVVGNPLDVIASGPTAPDSSTFAEAYGLIERYGLAETVPAAITTLLRRGVAGELPDTPKQGDAILARTHNVVVASNDIAARAAEEAALALGLNARVLTTYVEGEAREVAKVLAALAKETAASGRPAQRPACLILGGETTVTLRGQGKGGRNQEMALAAALCIQGLEGVAVVCLTTDGTDGPTDAT
ncbi:MAG: DUF4147 domain-containing protein, partial [Chloroflexota bacterium]